MKEGSRHQHMPTGFSSEDMELPRRLQEGGENELFDSVRNTLRKAERGEAIEPKSVMYVSPETMRKVLLKSRTKIIEYVARVKEVHSIADMAIDLRRDRSGISRDVKMLEDLGLLSVRKCVHPGHGHRKSITLAHNDVEVRIRFSPSQ